MNKQAKIIQDIPLSIEQYNSELIKIIIQQNIYYENMVNKALKKKTKKIDYPSDYGNIVGKYDIDVSNSINSRSVILTRDDSKDTDKIVIEINRPITISIHDDIKYLQKKLSEISSNIYIVHSDIINLYTFVLDQTIDSELEKIDKNKLSIDAFESKRRKIPEFNELLNQRKYKEQHNGLKDNFKQLHSEYISIYSDIEYLKSIKTQYEDEITRRLENCNTLEYYLSQKLRIVYNGLCETIGSLQDETTEHIDDEGLIEFDYREYPLMFDKRNGRIFAKREDDSLDLLGELENYTIVKQRNKKTGEKKRVSKFLVKKLLLKYLYLKRLLGYHIRQNITRPLERGDLVSFINEGEKHIGLISNISKDSIGIQTINDAINLMNDDNPILKYNISKDDVNRILPIREEIVHIKKLSNKGLSYNYELYMNHCKTVGKNPEIPIPVGAEPQLLKYNAYPSLTIKTITKSVGKKIVSVLKDRLPKVDRKLNEPLNNITPLPSVSELLNEKNSNILKMVSNLLEADALTTSHIENIDYVSNILEILKRRDNNVVEDTEETFMLFGGDIDDNTIFNDFKALDNSIPSSVAELTGIPIATGGESNSDMETISEDSHVSSLENTEQYGGMDVKNIIITEKV